MFKVLLFAGTSEGRRLAAALAQSPVEVLVSVATEYGGALLTPAKNQRILCKRLSRGEMAELIQGQGVELVIDATHPYAVEITSNLQSVCQELGTPYLRLLRGESAEWEVWAKVPCAAQAAKRLFDTQGNILLTTGSKELEPYTHIPGYRERVYPRILPSVEGVNQCLKLGFAASHIIAMQGPFSAQLNQALLEHTQARYLVTKDSGQAGGYLEKLAAANGLGVRVVVIARPCTEKGYTLGELCALLRERGVLAGTPS